MHVTMPRHKIGRLKTSTTTITSEVNILLDYDNILSTYVPTFRYIWKPEFCRLRISLR